MSSSDIERVLADAIYDAAVRLHPNYKYNSFSEKARIYVEHFERRDHAWARTDICPFCLARKAANLAPVDRVDGYALVDLTNSDDDDTIDLSDQ